MNITELYKYHCESPSDINEHLPTLRDLASECSTVTEMGVRWVVSTWGLAEGRPKKLTSIDIQDPIIYNIDIEKVAEIIRGEGIDFNFVLADTTQCDIEETELLFIDTWHVYEQLKVELERHGNKATKYLVFHDTVTFADVGETEGHKGLLPALEEFLEANPHWKIKIHYGNNNGLLVLERVSA